MKEAMGTYELDLHGLTWRNSLGEFMQLYDEAMCAADDPGSTQIMVVHGYGSTGEGGVLRTRLRRFLARFEDYLEFTPGEEIDGNYGCTIVRPLRHLPSSTELLSEDIWDYCQTPKTRSKIAGRFRRYGDPNVMEAIKSLEKQGRLRRVHKRRHTAYEAR